MTDLSFLIVSQYHTVLPGGYWFILIGPLLDGLLGGMCDADPRARIINVLRGKLGHTALTAASHAYFADCTDPEYRYVMFAEVVYVGSAQS